MLHSILLPLDRSPLAECTVEHGIRLAKAFGSSVWFLYIFKSSSLLSTSRIPPELQAQKDAELREVHRALDGLVEKLKQQSVKASAYLLLGTDPATLIVEHAAALQADLIVMGSHGRTGLAKIILGSVSTQVLEKCDRPVFVYRNVAQEHPPARGRRWVRNLPSTSSGRERGTC